MLEVFHPDRMASRILGMGDMMSLIEKAQKEFSEKDAKKLRKKISKNEFSLQDFYEQLQGIKKMGSMKSMISMLPGGNKMASQLDEVDVDKDLQTLRSDNPVHDQGRKGQSTSYQRI